MLESGFLHPTWRRVFVYMSAIASGMMVVMVLHGWPSQGHHMVMDTHSLIGCSALQDQNISGVPVAERQCTQHERISHMQKVCQKYPDLLTKKPSDRSIVDHNHRLLLCWMSKAGCTALKALILEANGMKINEKSKFDSLEGNALLIHTANTQNKVGVKQFSQLPAAEKITVIKDYFTTFAIRHPFSRLESYYRDKLVDMDPISSHPYRQAEILRFSRPDVFKNNPQLQTDKYPQHKLGKPHFDEFINWIHQKKASDDHWATIINSCHPCAHNWTALLRIETMDTDGKLLTDRLGTHNGGVPVRHSHEDKANHSIFSKHLDIYSNIKPEAINCLLDYFRVDLEMFGYGWDNESHTAYCAIPTSNGYCC